MKIMGIDASSKCTGISFFANNKLKTYKKIDLKKIKNTDERLRLMLLGVIEIIKSNKPEVIYFEDVWMGNNPSTSQLLAQLLGGIWGYCIMHNIRFERIKPSAWRKTLGFKGGRLKREELKLLSIDYVKKEFNIEADDDEADAICIGNAGILLEYERTE